MSIKSLMKSTQPAVLVLADGSIFRGLSIGVEGIAVGELVFNTGMTGYQEILTDPSYAEQLVVLTYPHIGNVGVNAQDSESHRVWTAGLVIRDLSASVSNYRAELTLQDFLKQHQQVAISGVDTRRLTRLLREKGAQHGCIMAGSIEIEKAQQLAKVYPGIQGTDLAKKVSTKERSVWSKGTFDIGRGEYSLKQSRYHIVVYDFGVKHQMLRLLVDRGCRLTLVPAQTPAHEVMALNPNGVLLSNGPGDPAACDYAIENIRKLMTESVPLFGICLGFQLIALACSAKTVKMKFGHHGVNHPVEEVSSQRVFISSQNHSFAVDTASLPDCLAITHRSLFDGSLQGIEHREKPVFAFQGHPESSPGPQDLRALFDHFITLIEQSSNAKT